MLTIEQKRHFEVFGFLVLRQLFKEDEIDEIRRGSDEFLRENRRGRTFPGEERQGLIPFFELIPELQWLIEDDRIYALGEDLLGPDFMLNATEGNLHVGNTQWHGGGPEPELVAHIKIAFYLEQNTKETGALRFIPGSHKLEFRKLLRPLTAQFANPMMMPLGVSGEDTPCCVIESQPGDVVVFPETLWHAAFGGLPGRSQHAINFMANPKTAEEITYVQGLYEGWEYSLHPTEQLVKSERPRLRRMVKRPVELGFRAPKPAPFFV